MPDPQGSFIWYELMTTDAEATGGFYSAVVSGWKFGERVPTDVEYRMIERSDGGNAGGDAVTARWKSQAANMP